MTSEKAILRLKEEIELYTPYAKTWDDARLDIEALEMAIQALETLDDIETLKHRSYLEGFHKAYQMYYKMFDDIKTEIQASMDMYKGCEYIGDKARRDELWHVLEIINKHTRKEQSK